MREEHRLAAVAAGVVAAHAVLLGALLGHAAHPARLPAGAGPLRAALPSTARITWLSLPKEQALGSAAATAAARVAAPAALPVPVARGAAVAARPTPGWRAEVQASLRAQPLPTTNAPALAELVPLAPLHPEPFSGLAQGPALPGPVAGIALPSHIGLMGGSRGFGGGRGVARERASAGVATGSVSGIAGPDRAAMAWRADLMAALVRHLPIDNAAAPPGTHGHCMAEDSPPRLRCDHPEVEATLGDASGQTIAMLLQRLAALSHEPTPPAMAYADGRFRLEWRSGARARGSE